MGLRRIGTDGLSYMYSSPGDGTVTVIIIHKDNSFNTRIDERSEGVVKWSRNLKKEPQEYVSLLIQALEGTANTIKEAKEGATKDDGEDDIFEVQDEYLVWKQYFATKKVYGKLGKFQMEKIDYEDAVKECLKGVMSDMTDQSSCNFKLQEQLEEKSKKLKKAKELAAKSVKAKEDFEKEIYGKCAVIINAKKHRILQLKSSNRPCPSPAINISEEAGPLDDREKRPIKKPRLDPNGSDGYSSDTDVDEPEIVDLSSGDEKDTAISSTSGWKDTVTIKVPKCLPGHFNTLVDSQELFNDSLEAELYPVSSTNKGLFKNGTEKNKSDKHDGEKLSEKNKSDKHEGEKLSPLESISSSQSIQGQSKQEKKKNLFEVESTSSIIDQLF